MKWFYNLKKTLICKIEKYLSLSELSKNYDGVNWKTKNNSKQAFRKFVLSDLSMAVFIFLVSFIQLKVIY